MISEVEGRAVTRLTQRLLSVRPLGERLCGPGGFAETVDAGTAGPGARAVLGLVLERLRFPPGPSGRPTGAPGPGTEALVRVVRDRVGISELAPVLASIAPSDRPDVERIVDEVVREDLDSFCEGIDVTAPDGIRFRAYAAGDPRAPALVIASACGMPVRLAERWIRRFAVDHRVIIWESRGLFGAGVDDPGGFDAAVDVPAQAGDLLAAMTGFGVERAHVLGLCGGAVLALDAAARAPERVGGLSLWHGDFDLGPGTPKTDHQLNLQALMGMATGSRVGAARIQAVVGQAMLAATPPDLAHLVVYPYATPELLFRYCRLNGAIMGQDLSETLTRMRVPVLVVTSQDDRTAHADGSRRVAERLPGARLVVNERGDHLSLFRAEPSYLEAAARLIDDLAPPV